jgi:hypothetical protein
MRTERRGMIDYKQVAALALAKCAAYDPWFPKASQAIVDSWAEQVEKYKLELPDVLAGVTKMYSENGSGFRPLPKDLIDAARSIRRDRMERVGEWTLPRNAEMDKRALEAITSRVGTSAGKVVDDA